MKKGERRAFDILFRLGCLVVAIAAILIWRLAELPYFGPAVGAILVLFFLVSGTVPGLLRYRTIGKRIEALAPLLYTDPDRYIEETERVLGDTRSDTLQQVRLVNLGAAYCVKGAYRIGADHLEKVDPEKLAPAQRGIYWADLALTQFHLDRRKRGSAILHDHADLLAPLEGHPKHGGMMAVLRCFALLEQNEPQLAAQELDVIRSAWGDDPAIRRELDYLRRKMAARTGKKTGL